MKSDFMRPQVLVAVAIAVGACSTTPPAVRLTEPSGLEQVVVEAFGLE